MRKILLGFFTVIGILVVTLIVLGAVLTMTSHDKKRTSLPDKMVLTLALDQDMSETASKTSMLNVLSAPQMTLYDTIQTMDRARQDQRVIGIAAKLSNNAMGLASMQELRDAVHRFERSGKFAYLYIDDLGGNSAMSEYWLATAFDQIWLHPIGSLALTGFAVDIPFAKDFLDKVGIQAELLHQGKYKSFPESVMRRTISDENRTMTASLLHSIRKSFYSDVYETRHVTANRMDKFIDQSLIPAEDALAGGLIDSIGYRDEFDAYLEQATKGTAAVAIADYYANGARSVPGEKMAMINVHGALTTISPEESFSNNVVSADMISGTIREAAENADVKAIILRVDSPGGTPLAADIIRRAVQIARESKPVIISMSNAAASGGYWMSADASAIIAQPTTLTGSIGVFGGKFNAAGLFDKLGIHWDQIADDNNANLWSISEPYNATSRAKIDAMMAKTYQQFIARVAQGRQMTPLQVEKIAQGRVWTGAQARKIGLVDALGGLDVAVSTAKAMAKIPEHSAVNLEVFPKPLNPIQQVMKFIRQGLPAPLISSWIHQNFSALMNQLLLSWATPIIRG